MRWEHDVLVVGGGAAGLAASDELARAGLRVALLEARDRLGGRVETVRDRRAGLTIELGAEFVHGRPPAVLDLAAKLGLKVSPVAEAAYRREGGVWIPERDYWRPLDSLFSRLRSRGHDRSMERFLSEHSRGAREREAARRARMFVEGFHAADVSRMSEFGLAALFKRAGGALETSRRVDEGYAALLRPWTARGAFLETIVTELHWRPGHARAVTRGPEGRSRVFEAPAAVITLPLGVLKARPGFLGTVRFVPDIAAHRAAAEKLEMGAALRVSLKFQRAFWPQDAAFLIREEQPFAVWWTARPRGAALLTGWTGGPAAAALSRQGKRAVLDAALGALARLCGLPLGEVTDLLETWYFHDWLDDPFSRGAYSYAAVGGAGAHAELAKPEANTLFFAGEATDFEGQNATVAGAIASGRRAAREVLPAVAAAR